MKIDLNNYEEWAIDYIEGSIPTDIKDSFELFLAQNPDIESKIYSLIQYMPTLKCEPVTYPHKTGLMKGHRRFLSFKSIGLYATGAVAATLFFGLFLLISPNNKSEEIVAEATRDVAKIEILTPSKTIAKIQESVEIHTPTANPIARNTTRAEAHTNINTKRKFYISTEFEPIGSQIAILNKDIKLSTPQTLAYISDTEMTHVRTEERPSDIFRQTLATFIAPIDRLSPIKIYRTETGRGVEIASRYRIGRK